MRRAPRVGPLGGTIPARVPHSTDYSVALQPRLHAYLASFFVTVRREQRLQNCVTFADCRDSLMPHRFAHRSHTVRRPSLYHGILYPPAPAYVSQLSFCCARSPAAMAAATALGQRTRTRRQWRGRRWGRAAAGGGGRGGGGGGRMPPEVALWPKSRAWWRPRTTGAESSCGRATKTSSRHGQASEAARGAQGHTGLKAEACQVVSASAAASGRAQPPAQRAALLVHVQDQHPAR